MQQATQILVIRRQGSYNIQVNNISNTLYVMWGLSPFCIIRFFKGDFCTCYVRLFREFGHYDKTNLLKCPWMCVCF
ncbi:hypothetical protein GLYMA_18G172400v4 [Glycine max]|uniref:Uncharacterized protein n=1 Tax=Glycine max TaxID=3847 RepID=K7MSX2_SOYBN|nr:hypothetical protein GYH30_050250 [Glycine max]KRG99811.1 hypothetical protein GLYMA_18G172400v4 [Glycine max]